MSHGLLLRLAGAALAAAVLCAAGCGRPADPAPETPATPPAANEPWVRPAPGPGAEPVWGMRGGLAVGLWPTGGPRGLIRVYAPYLGQPHGRVVNFIAVEPVVNGVRGQSELEVGRVSGGPGLAMWTADTRDGLAGGPGGRPAAGRVEHIDGAEALTIWLATEPFRNGARPVLQIVLRADRPHEVAFRIRAAPGGTPPDACVLTATMGNYARLRRLWLRGEVVDARLVWPTFVPDPLGFAPWRAWGRDRLLTAGGDLVAAATPDEADPAGATYDPAVPTHWRYVGRPATQYWRTADVPGAVARVNGRTTYWGRGGPIPGGVAYENFELEVPFADGQELRFGVTPAGPAGLGFDPAWVRNRTGG